MQPGHVPYPNTRRHAVVGAVLQFHWHDIDPDSARTLAVHVIEALDRLEEHEAKRRAAAAKAVAA